MRVSVLMSLCALALAPTTAGNALSIDANFWGNLAYDNGANCTVKKYSPITDTPAQSLEVILSWPGEEGWLVVPANVPTEMWVAPTNTPGNPAMLRTICGAVVKKYRARITQQWPEGIDALLPNRFRVSDDYLPPDSFWLDRTTCHIKFPPRPSSGQTQVRFALNFERDDEYTGEKNIPQLTWNPDAMPTERRALAVRACNAIAADLAQRLEKLQ